MGTPSKKRDFAYVLEMNQRELRELPPDISWPASAIPKEGVRALIVDGYNSESRSHIANEFHFLLAGVATVA